MTVSYATIGLGGQNIIWMWHSPNAANKFAILVTKEREALQLVILFAYVDMCSASWFQTD